MPKKPDIILVRWLDADLSTSDEGKARNILEDSRPTYLESVGYCLGVSEYKGEQFLHLSFDFDVSEGAKPADEGWYRSHQKIPTSLIREVRRLVPGKRLWKKP
jgi:hypothetical protein